jgi:hypothetical protein
MSSDRREFLGTLLAVGVAGKSGIDGSPPGPATAAQTRSSWDVRWTEGLTARHRAVFDSPEMSQGLALVRTLVWYRDYAEVYGTPPADMNAVVVLRHNGIWMIMDDEFWDHHEVGSVVKIDDPKTGKPIRRNPFLGPTPYSDIPPLLADEALKKVLARATVLACNLAFQDVVERVKEEAGGDLARARSMALHHIVPGIILQPSGVFAVTRAEEAGCRYFLAS